MRCISCQKLSVSVVCRACEARLLTPTVSRRQVVSLEVVSLFKYSTLEPFLLHKHAPLGYRIYRYFGRKFVDPFLRDYVQKGADAIHLIGVDERVDRGYAHVALLTHAVRHRLIRVDHAALIARNTAPYAGKSLQYRLDHPRDFHYRGAEGIDAVVIDDVVTTGATLREAHQRLREAGVNVLFALTLADARQ